MLPGLDGLSIIDELRQRRLKLPVIIVSAKRSIDLLRRSVTRAGKKIDLQPREFSLLQYLARNAGRMVSKTTIMEHVWDYNFDAQTNVVE